MSLHLHSKYQISLEVFEGPLDLLLHLIKKNDINIHDIPIAFILDQYMEYISLMEELNIDLAGDFLLMASELALIKSKLLLPTEEQVIEEEEGEDPRSELIKKLLEYQRYKEGAAQLLQGPMLDRDVFYLGSVEDLHEEEEPPLKADLFQLMSCFQDLLKKVPKVLTHQVQAERMSVADRIYELMDQLKGRPMIEFSYLFSSDRSRPQMIITFMAILEMTRLDMMRITQAEDRGEIYLTPCFEAASVENLEENVTIQ